MIGGTGRESITHPVQCPSYAFMQIRAMLVKSEGLATMLHTSTIFTLVITWFAAALLALSCTSALAITHLRTAAQETAEPKFVETKQGDKTVISGLCIEIMKAIERIEPQLKFNLDPQSQSLARLETGLAVGTLDAVCGLIRTKEREAKFTYVDPPLYRSRFLLAVRADDDVRINNWGDVRKLGEQGTILIISGHGAIKKLQAQGGLNIDSSAKDPRTNIQKLLGGRGRFFYHRSPGIQEEIRNVGASNKVKVLPTVMDSQSFHMALSNTLPAETVAKVRKAVELLANSGELNKLLDKWDGD